METHQDHYTAEYCVHIESHEEAQTRLAGDKTT